jgi:hypothetical protein
MTISTRFSTIHPRSAIEGPERLRLRESDHEDGLLPTAGGSKPSKPDFADGKSLSSKNSASVGAGISKRSETVVPVFPPVARFAAKERVENKGVLQCSWHSVCFAIDARVWSALAWTCRNNDARHGLRERPPKSNFQTRGVA